MRNYVQRGNTLTVPSPREVTSGQGVIVGAIFGVANEDAVFAAPVDLDLEGVFALPKVAALAIGLCEVVYWDDVARLVTTTEAGNARIGVATEAVANPSPSVPVRLNGSF